MKLWKGIPAFLLCISVFTGCSSKDGEVPSESKEANINSSAIVSSETSSESSVSYQGNYTATYKESFSVSSSFTINGKPADGTMNIKIEDEDIKLNFDFGDEYGKFSGEVNMGIPNGFGSFTGQGDNGANWIYEGEWKDGKFNGKGKIVWEKNKNGQKEVQEGIFQMGKLTSGTQTINDKLVYQGEFNQEGKYEGSGTLYNDDGSVKYTGKFKAGNPADTDQSAPTDQVYKDGQYKVGTDIPAGVYKLIGKEKDAVVKITKDANGTEPVILEYVQNFRYVELKDGQFIQTVDYEIRSKDTKTPPVNGVYLPGQYLVGTDIPAGEYKAYKSSGSLPTVYTITKDANGKDFVSQNYFDDSHYLTVSNGEYLLLQNAEIR